jgi:hypothetical protein
MRRARRLLPQLVAAGVLTAGLVAAVTAFSGAGFAQGTAAQAEYAPANTTPPSISGTPQVGRVLTATPGAWNSTSTPTFAYQWQRCNTTGGACAGIAGATAQTYTVQQSDAGSTLRVRVTASNTGGSTAAQSLQTAVVQTPGTTSNRTVRAADVKLPNRLVVDRVRFSPAQLTSRRAFVARFHVSDTVNRKPVVGALVYALGLPYSWARKASEVQTDGTGWATITMQPTRNLPLRRGGALVIFVRARVQGDSLLAGSPTRRLVQVTIRYR